VVAGWLYNQVPGISDGFSAAAANRTEYSMQSPTFAAGVFALCLAISAIFSGLFGYLASYSALAL